MPGTFTCHHCGKTFPYNPRLKKVQKYCSSPICQQVRRSARKNNRYHSDSVYRRKHLARQKAWRDAYPAHEYQKQYRADHPGYVLRNQEQQRGRNKKRKKELLPMIVNGTSLSLRVTGDKAYALIKINKQKIVNGTSFIAQMHILSDVKGVFRQKGT